VLAWPPRHSDRVGPGFHPARPPDNNAATSPVEENACLAVQAIRGNRPITLADMI